MGRKGGFITAVKRVVSCGSKQKRVKRDRSSDKWLEQLRSTDFGVAESSISAPAAVHSPVEETKLNEAEDEHNRHAYSVALATAAAAEAVVAAAQAAAEVVRLTSTARYMGRTKEELAAIKIQTAFRGHLARRALRALKGLVRLKSLIGSQSAKRQSTNTLKCMQTMARVQFEVRTRRIKMSEENLSLQRQIQLKRDKEVEKLQGVSIGENWDDSIRSKEQIEASRRGREEAAVRRERALAYAYSHQQTWRNPTNGSTTSNKLQTFMDPNNPRWGWSWLERWMSAAAADQKPQSPRRRGQSPSTPTSTKSISIRGSSAATTNIINSAKDKDDSSSIKSLRSYHRRRTGSDDDVSLSSCPTGSGSRRYMASTESTRAKARPPSPLGRSGGDSSRSRSRVGNSSPASVKKRLSFSASPDGRPRRHSGPPKVDAMETINR
ncbi:protein IQ-DOMAIN 3-like [Andrographis paniculata]|uniref:protein IQ-DOMAIN 3-like n=1 Tax=Andrographis paniculata TaxID=175694 RepID=UPI0021E8A58B|nr:protein IQ-DOMAIN 3-like [Andrographis paniculata]XP_051140173.1 protein IQ-DOMAIN 3-like [Andrographis paniculata]